MDPKDKPTSSASASAQACPVDPSTRAAWLEKAASATASAASNTTSSQSQSSRPSQKELPTSRTISSIPRASNLSESPSSPSNAEQLASSSVSGNWIYPSEKMFFEAMRRKNYTPRQDDMKTIVPIHNAVNERAWKQIREWERGWGSESCGGPKLRSFSGQSKAMTPRARWNTLLGYTPPFDRHDWVIDRCGKEVEYVIDFYEGKKTSNNSSGGSSTGASGGGSGEGKGKTVNGPGLSFYLDVRPKINSWEGVKMRVWRMFGDV